MAATILLMLCASAILIATVNGVYQPDFGCENKDVQFPYISYFSIEYTPSGGGPNVVATGTGTLIDENYVLIGAEVPYQVSIGTFVSGLVIIGACDPNNPGNATTFTNLRADDLRFDPRYTPSTPVYNVGVIRLPCPVTNVTLAKLISDGDVIMKSDCFVIGYGPNQTTPNQTTSTPSTPTSSPPAPNPVAVAYNPLLCSLPDLIKCVNRLTASNPTTSTFLSTNITNPTSENPFYCIGFFNPPPNGTFKGPCGADISGPLQCNLAGQRGNLANQKLVGFVRFPSCNLPDPNGQGSAPSVITNIFPMLDTIKALTPDPFCNMSSQSP